ncbi:hypothetical protein [Bradyrhizobium sp. Ec3.3]|nr:hypothetical protein [Bradyrhizobium sp. Ec3.3]
MKNDFAVLLAAMARFWKPGDPNGKLERRPPLAPALVARDTVQEKNALDN